MTTLEWDKVSEKIYETGVDRGVLYIPNNTGVYNKGYAWNGLVSVTESPSGAEANKQYANNQVYVNLYSAEEFGATLEAFTYPDQFAQCDGSATPTPGIRIGQQSRKSFGLAYRTRVGNDLEGSDFAYKLHLVYGATAAPSERAYTTINDSPEAITLSWELSTTKVDVPGFKPTALLVIDSSEVDEVKLAELEKILYGIPGTDPRLPAPAEVISMFDGTSIEVTPDAPTYNPTTDVLTIPTKPGVIYQIAGATVTGSVPITADTVVEAVPAEGYHFPDTENDDWFYDFT
jgi:hypothetical protein